MTRLLGILLIFLPFAITGLSGCSAPADTYASEPNEADPETVVCRKPIDSESELLIARKRSRPPTHVAWLMPRDAVMHLTTGVFPIFLEFHRKNGRR